VRIVRLLADLLSTVRRDLASGMDVKAEAMAAGFLHVMGQLSPENVRYRSAALSEDGAIEHLTAAQAVANEANAAAVEAKFDETPSIALAQSIPSVQELRQAAGIFRTTGLVSRLFGSEWRRAKAVWRQTFPTERRTSPVDTARRLMSAALWKERLARLEANSGAKAAAGRYWLDAATAFEPLLQVAAWMKLVRSQTPLAESGARELRRLAFEGGPDAIVMLSDLAHTAEELDLLGVFRKCYAQKSSIAAEAQRQVERASALRKAWATAGQFGLRPGNAITALADAVAALRNVSECRKSMAHESIATNAASAITGRSDIDKATKIKTTLEHVTSVLAAHLPVPVTKRLLQEGSRERTERLKKIARDIDASISTERRAAEDADSLLKLRLDEWCGGPVENAPFEALLHKCRIAAQSPTTWRNRSPCSAPSLRRDNLA
jgi:hypothetical protein